MFSKLTYIYGISIIISASFLQQILVFLNKTFGDKFVELFFYLFCLIGIGYFFTRVITKQFLTLKQIIITEIIIILTIVLMWIQPDFAEKTHVVLYGCLGYLAVRDLCCKNLGAFRILLYASIFTFLISLLDELFQAILPYRVGDLRDILTNTCGSFLGFALYLALNQFRR